MNTEILIKTIENCEHKETEIISLAGYQISWCKKCHLIIHEPLSPNRKESFPPWRISGNCTKIFMWKQEKVGILERKIYARIFTKINEQNVTFVVFNLLILSCFLFTNRSIIILSMNYGIGSRAPIHNPLKALMAMCPWSHGYQGFY